LKYGLTVHNVEAIKMLTIDGEALSLSRQDTGLGLLALMNGSEGLLGIVTEVTVKASIDLILFSFESPKTTDSSSGIAPPDKPVPAPRVTTGVLCALQIFNTCLICSTLWGNTTAKGFCRYTLKPSHSNGRVFSSPVRTLPLDTNYSKGT
jgi:hypothetical protein